MQTPSNRSDPGRRELLVLTSDSFGNAVGERLRPVARVTVQDMASGTHPSLWPHAELIVLATSNERPQIADAVDRMSFAWGIPWFAVHAGATEVSCGPVVIPGVTACHGCYVRGRQQHRLNPEATNQDIQAPPAGHPRHHAGIAAGLARQAVDEVFGGHRPTALGGTVRRFDQITGATSRSEVVATNNCRRCRDQGPAPCPTELRQRLTAASAELSRLAPSNDAEEATRR